MESAMLSEGISINNILQPTVKTKTEFLDEFSKEVFEQTYSYGKETIDDAFCRIAENLASVEKDTKHWAEQFLSILKDFKFVPGGRIISNAGTGLTGTTLLNCYVDGFLGEDQDSMEGILAALRRQALILKSEGGYGFCADTMRPCGSFINGIGNESPGSVKMLEMWDTQSAVITAGSGRKSTKEKAKIKIRKGAQMVTMSCWHPDIEEFIVSKQTPGRLTKFNMSVLITDEFMNAVENNLSWSLEFPDYDANKIEYKKEWDGNLKKWKEKGYAIKIHKTFNNANELWDLITQSTYNRNEPGVLFIDAINRLNNLYYSEYINSTNPSLRKGTRVLTNKGIFPIEELQDKEISVLNLNNEWSSAKCFLSGKNKQLYKIQFKNGIEIYATAEHKWPVLLKGPREFGKVATTQLQPGHLMPFPRNSALNFDTNLKLSYEEGMMVGWLYGDGWITDKPDGHTEYGFLFNNFEEDYIGMKILTTVNSFKSQPSSIKPQQSGGHGFQIASHEFELRMKEVYGIKSKHNLPTIIWQASDSFIKGFLDGLFSADGCIYLDNKNHKITLTNKSKTFTSELQELLGFYGVKTTRCFSQATNVSFPNSKQYDKTYDRYDVSINGDEARYFGQLVSFSHQEKREKLKLLSEIVKLKRKHEQELVQVKSVEVTDLYEDVWDISVFDNTHCFRISPVVTGNCGEQILPVGGVCLLGSLNLTQFVDFENQNWNYEKLKETISIAIRMLDNVNDITYTPLDIQKENLKNKRRIGLGKMGYGSALMMMKIRYGSDYALKITDELDNFIMNEAYQASALLAKEKGAFLLYDEEKYLNGFFVKQLDDKTKNLIKKHGIRNSHLLSIQPTGNTSILANIISGGLEPVFMPTYKRTTIMPFAPEGLDLPKNIDWESKKFESTTNWEWIKEGDENLLKMDFNNYIWKFDKSRGLLRETVVKDYAVKFLETKGEWNEKADWAATTTQLAIDEHLKTMVVMAKYIDSAMSKTINIPSDYSYEDFQKVYFKLYKSGVVKGCTTYRAGTMTEVLGAVKKENFNRIQKTNALKRPKTLDCEIYNVTAEGEKWIVIVGILEDEPYEVFAFKPKSIHLPIKIKNGKLTKAKRGKYDLECEGFVIENLTEHFATDEHEAVTRLISISLRHGADVKFIIEQLNKSEGTITSFGKAIARALKKYIPDGTKSSEAFCSQCNAQNSIVYQEGCAVCLSCSNSKCG